MLPVVPCAPRSVPNVIPTTHAAIRQRTAAIWILLRLRVRSRLRSRGAEPRINAASLTALHVTSPSNVSDSFESGRATKGPGASRSLDGPSCADCDAFVITLAGFGPQGAQGNKTEPVGKRRGSHGRGSHGTVVATPSPVASMSL